MTADRNASVRNNEARSQFELPTDAGLAFAAYEREGEVWTFTHTIVPPEAEGHGVASALIRTALETVDGAGGRVVPQCRFVRAYIDRHPEWARLLAH